MKIIRFIFLSSAVSLFLFFSRPAYSGQFRNPALLVVSVPVISLFVGVIVSAAFISPTDEKNQDNEKSINPTHALDRALLQSSNRYTGCRRNLKENLSDVFGCIEP